MVYCRQLGIAAYNICSVGEGPYVKSYIGLAKSEPANFQLAKGIRMKVYIVGTHVITIAR